MAYDLQIGRLKLITAEEGLAEQLGDSIDTAGGVPTAGDRRARQSSLTVPVNGDPTDVDPYISGDRLRRQVRALFDNNRVKNEAIYMKVGFDTELNAWWLFGAAELAYAEGGVSLADYKLTVGDAYKLSDKRRFRPAKRVAASDRRVSTVAADIEGRYFTGIWPAVTAQSVAFTPPGAIDVWRSTGPVAPAALTSNEGDLGVVSGVVDGEVLHYEQADADSQKADVTILDRRGNTAAFGIADVDPQATLGWEEVYGPNYPLTAGDVPVLQNGLCRVRYVAAVRSFALDQWVVGTGWVERGRAFPQVQGSHMDTLRSVTVKEWTPERAVLKVRMHEAATDTVNDIYLILQRGWTGPRIEVYTRSTAVGGPQLFWVPNTNAEMVLHTNTVMRASQESWNGVGVSMPTSGGEPWVSIYPQTGTDPRVTVASAYTDNSTGSVTTFDASAGTSGYATTNRGVRFRGVGTSALAWGGWDFRIGGQKPVWREAETDRNGASGTTSQVADGGAYGGQMVRDTQAASTNATLAQNGGIVGLANGTTYDIWVRVKVQTGGATASLRTFLNPTAGAIVTTTSTTYTWVKVGSLSSSNWAGVIPAVIAYRSAGAGGVDVDSWMFVPRSSSAADGTADVGAQSLSDTRMINELVAR